MAESSVTIVVVPRERFSAAERSLETLYANTPPPFELVYVTGGTPAPLLCYLQAAAEQRGFRLIAHDRYLSPNQARNIALQHVSTEYVAFVDNDILVAPGWLERLVACAEETGAWLVGPLYYTGEFEQQMVHMAGGSLAWEDRQGQRVLAETLIHLNKSLSSYDRPLGREPTDFVEFHCMLVRMEFLQRYEPLDEKLRSLHDHIDIALTARQVGGEVYFEPAARIAFLEPPPFAWWDLPWFMVRWNDTWATESIQHFKEKWNVDYLAWPGRPPHPSGEDMPLIWTRMHRGKIGKERISIEECPPPGSMPREEAGLMAILLHDLGRDTFDIALATADNEVHELQSSLHLSSLLQALPFLWLRAEATGSRVLIRPLPVSPDKPLLVQTGELDSERLALLREFAFLVIQTSTDSFQCWLALKRDDPLLEWTLSALGGSPRQSNQPGWGVLPGSRCFHHNAGQDRVRLIEVKFSEQHSLSELMTTDRLTTHFFHCQWF